jgi:hypothetical protein
MRVIFELYLALALLAVTVGGGIIVTLWLAAHAAGSAARASRDRLRRRDCQRLTWSSTPQDIAKAIIAEQSISFWVEHRRDLQRRRIEFLLVPMTEVRAIATPTGDGVRRGCEWHVWQSSNGHGCATRVPISGRDLADRMMLTDLDAIPVREALDVVMQELHELQWAG